MEPFTFTNVKLDPAFQEEIDRIRARSEFVVTLDKRPPLILTYEGPDQRVPDELHMIAPDGTRREFAICGANSPDGYKRCCGDYFGVYQEQMTVRASVVSVELLTPFVIHEDAEPTIQSPL